MTDNIHVNSPYDRGEGAHAGRLFRGERRLSASEGEVAPTIATQNSSGDIAGNPAYRIPGSSALLNGNGNYGIMPAIAYMGNITWGPMSNPEGYIYRDTLLYRSDSTPRRDGPLYRTLPSSPTTPVDRYRFLDGRRGDVYG